MKAYVRTSADDMNVALVDLPIPAVDANEVRIQIRAVGVGVHDRYFIPADATFPYVIGLEGAGVITDVGNGVTGFSVGDSVILTSVMRSKGGCWSEYVVVESDALIRMPDGLAFTQAAAIPVAGKTALECIRNLDLNAGDTVFIAGASGAVGSLAIQLAVARGIRVCGSASSQNHDYLLSLGAEKAVDYNQEDWKQEVLNWQANGVTAALAIQPDTAADSMAVVRDGGRVIAVSGDHVVGERGILVSQLEHHPDTGKMMPALAADIAAGRIKQVIEQVYPFDQALDALKKTETRHARGKTVVRFDG